MQASGEKSIEVADATMWNVNRRGLCQVMAAIKKRVQHISLQEVILRKDVEFIQCFGHMVFFANSSGREARTALAVRADRLVKVQSVAATQCQAVHQRRRRLRLQHDAHVRAARRGARGMTRARRSSSPSSRRPAARAGPT